MKTTKPKPDEMYVCLESFGFQEPDGPRAYQKGTRLRGNQPVVKQHAQFWAPDGLDDVELQRLRVERGLVF